MFPIQKQDSVISSTSGSNANRDVDKNSETVNLTYTKAKKERSDTTSKDLSYNDPDSNTNVLSNFTTNHTPGNYFENFQQTRNTLTKSTDFFFQLFFTDEVLRTIAQHTNSCAWINIANIQTYCDTGAAWKETDSKEIKTFIGLLLYQGLICAN